MTTKFRSLFLATLTLGLSTWSLDAAATSNFPKAIKSHLDLSSAPACTLCHTTLSGGDGTVTRAFGIAMRGQGLEPNDTSSLNDALDALEAAGTDSDSDGVGDIDELKAGTNPNVADATASSSSSSGSTESGSSSGGGESESSSSGGSSSSSGGKKSSSSSSSGASDGDDDDDDSSVSHEDGTTTTASKGGCSSAGQPGQLGSVVLFGLAALLIRRRRQLA